MEVIIMRGVPGSGKSTWIKANLPHDKTLIVSADHFWIQEDGSYKFNVKKIAEAHRICMNHFLAAFDDNHCSFDYLVVDNTNISPWEFAPYVAVAEALDVKVKIVQIDTEIEIAIGRQIHGVPGANLRFMDDKLYSEDIPYRFRNLIEYHDGD